MLKVNLIYPISIKRQDKMIFLESKDFGISIESESLVTGISEIKELIIKKIVDLSDNNEAPPIPQYLEDELGGVAYIEIDSSMSKNLCERVNMSIPKNLLEIIDLRGLNRSSYVSNLILEDILKRNRK